MSEPNHDVMITSTSILSAYSGQLIWTIILILVVVTALIGCTAWWRSYQYSKQQVQWRKKRGLGHGGKGR